MGLNITVAVTGAHASLCPYTQRAFCDHIDAFGPDDFFMVKKSLERMAASLSLPQMLSFLRLSHWDANVFGVLYPYLSSRLLDACPTTSRHWLYAVRQVRDAHFSLGMPDDLVRACSALASVLEHRARVAAPADRSRSCPPHR